MSEAITSTPAQRLESRLAAEVSRLIGGKEIGPAVDSLHRRFVSEAPLEPERESYLASKELLAAYLAYFYLSSAAQVRRALKEVVLPSRATLRVLDVGSGPGPGAMAVAQLAREHGRTVEVVALEPAALALQVMRRLWDSQSGTLNTIEWRAGSALPAGPFDMIVVSHAMNELFIDEGARLDRRAAFAADLGARLSEDGLLLLLEPALKRTARELLVVRDRLIQKGMAALAPCVFQGSCPAIAKPRDWCHADRPWDEPQLVRESGEAGGVSRDSLKFAYVVIGRRHPNPPMTKDSTLFRIVSEPLPEKGKLRYFGCGPAGRHALTRLDKDAAPANEAFTTLERGDIVRVEGLTPTGDGRRLSPTSLVKVEVEARDLDGRST